MRIGADGMYMRFRRTGLGHFQDGLLHAMADQMAPREELYVYYNSLPATPMFEPPVRERFVRMPRPLLWNQVGVAAALALDRCDVYLGNANILPRISRLPTVLYLHDCIPFSDPASHAESASRYLRRWMASSAKQATRLTSNSHWTAEQAERYLGLRADDFVVIPPGLGPGFGPEPVAADEEAGLRQRIGVTGAYVLHVGAFERYKGGPDAVAAVRTLREAGEDVVLVRCGGDGPNHGGGDAMELGYVDDQTLAALYRHASVVCLPSSVEGFGIPVIEAMASGAPVVAYRAGALPETVGDAAVLVDPGDTRGLAEAIRGLLPRGEPWQRLRQAGLVRAQGYTWASAATKMLGVVREAVGAGGRRAAGART